MRENSHKMSLQDFSGKKSSAPIVDFKKVHVCWGKVFFQNHSFTIYNLAAIIKF